MRNIHFIFLLFTSLSAFGQIDLDADTMVYRHNTGGAIDTFDISNADLPTTFEGGRSILSLKGVSSASLYDDLTTRRFQRFTKFDPLTFSALPHLGFAYSFGGQGSQFVRLDYNQSFSEQVLFNLKYDRNAGTGFLQNSGYTENNLRAQLQRDAKRYSFQLQASFQSFTLTHPGGVLDDSSNYDIIDTVGLEFATVNKDAASSITKLGSVYLKNYFNVSPDSLNHFGLTTHHHYSITYREYLESADLSSVYSTINIDSVETRDQFNSARIRNAAGVYFSNRRSQFYFDALLEHGYWNFQNLGLNTDTNEFGLVTNLRVKIKEFVLSNEARLNLVGGFNEWSENAQLTYGKGPLKVRGGLLFKNAAPDPFQRNYFANNFNYSLASINKQVFLRAGGGLKWKVKDSLFNLDLSGDFNSISSAYVFDDSTWRNDTLSSYTFASIRAKGQLTLGKFGFYPTIVYSLDNNNYLPNFQFYSRLFVKTKIFKAKKLEFLFGVDASYMTKFNNRLYVPAMDAFNMFVTPGTSQTEGMFNLHAFVSFGIEEFRFYVRYENIGYFWNDRTNEELSGYPIAANRLRIGLTWDFFN